MVNSSVAHSERNNSSKRPRKKTLAELKDEESSLLKERRVLEREMAAMRSNLERRRAENEKIKRAKIEFMRSTEEEDSVKFALPDLNVPFDEHTSDVACGC
ncbi:hypothetical protein M569_09813 [Genlisea aurea]|uniref:Uncharacterized protein n=1 Tax=Genlisea aurea TaxID=192259 RepID=S8DYE2_9LAMI|nr:hypothetical protein M569_09813 [Genlisea aurea]